MAKLPRAYAGRLVRRLRTSPPPPDPGQPFPVDHRDDVGEALGAYAAAFDHLDHAQPARLADRGLRQRPGHPGTGRNGVQAQLAGSAVPVLVRHDPEHGQLARGEAGGQGRRHRSGRGEPAAALDRDGADRGALRLAEKSCRSCDSSGGQRGFANLANLPDRAPRLDQARQFLGLGFADTASPERLPKRCRDLAQPCKRRGLGRPPDFLSNHRPQPSTGRGAGSRQAFPVARLAGLA